MLATYSSKDVTISLGGAAVEGWVSLTMSTTSDLYTPKVAADGKVGLMKSADGTATGVLTLLGTSHSNYFLSAYYNGLKFGNTVPVALAVNDPSGAVLALAQGVLIMKAPDIELADEVGDKAWNLFIENLDFVSTPEAVGATLSDAQAASVSSGVATILGNFS